MCQSVIAMLDLVLGVILVSLLCVGGQYVESPCPGVFEYKTDGSGLYGVIHVRPTAAVSTLQLRANFTIAARLVSSYVGRLEPINSNPQNLQDYNRGVPLQYRVDFPVTSPLPRPTAITVNDNVLCYGPAEMPGPNQYVTTTSLQHTLFLKGGASPGFFNQYEQPNPMEPSQDINFFNQFPSDGETQIFTIGEDGNKQSWNSITYPNQRPEFERPISRPPPPTRVPEPQYFPEPVTQPPPPPPQRPAPSSNPSRQPEASTSVECGVVSGGNERQPLVYNGQTYSRGDWPWLVAIYKRQESSLGYICAGTLVSDRHVISAAHCMQQRGTIYSNTDIVVKIGVHNLEDWADDITVTRKLASYIVHESYDTSTLANDILVMTLERRVDFNVNIRPACLWNGNPDLSRIVGASGVVAGWGASESGAAGRGEPRMVRVPVASTAACRASRPEFHKLTSSNTICAGDRKGSGPCLGDSGGGLYLLEGGRWRLRGVVSISLRGKTDGTICNLNEYVVFTDSAKYLSWIQNIMRSS